MYSSFRPWFKIGLNTLPVAPFIKSLSSNLPSASPVAICGSCQRTNLFTPNHPAVSVSITSSVERVERYSEDGTTIGQLYFEYSLSSMAMVRGSDPFLKQELNWMPTCFPAQHGQT